MEVLVFLVPLALMLGFAGLLGFLWSLKNGQYDDLEGAGWRAIADDEPAPSTPLGVMPTEQVPSGPTTGPIVLGPDVKCSQVS